MDASTFKRPSTLGSIRRREHADWGEWRGTVPRVCSGGVQSWSTLCTCMRENEQIGGRYCGCGGI